LTRHFCVVTADHVSCPLIVVNTGRGWETLVYPIQVHYQVFQLSSQVKSLESTLS